MCSGGEEKREKKMRWVRGCICVVREKKKERQRGYMGGGRKKKKGNKKEKRNGKWNLRVWWEKKGNGKEKKKIEREKLNWFYLYVHFVWCKV